MIEIYVWELYEELGCLNKFGVSDLNVVYCLRMKLILVSLFKFIN